MNPIRSLAPALVVADGADLWLSIVGPTLGALAGAALYGYLRDAREAPRSAALAVLVEEEAAR